jgi:hypothetical protein
MVVITEEIKNFVNFQKLGYVATVSNDNTPNLSPKGTIMVLDDRFGVLSLETVATYPSF